MRMQASYSEPQFITISQNPMLPPRLLCSVKIRGNTHQVYYEFDGSVASIVSQIVLNETAYLTTVFINEDTAYFTSVMQNGVAADVTLSQAKTLWPSIREGLSCAERSYTPAIQNALEPSDLTSEIDNSGTLDNKIKSLDIRSFQLRIAYKRLTSFINKAKKYHSGVTTTDIFRYQADYNQLKNDYDVVIKLINKLLRSPDLNEDQINCLTENLNHAITEKNEIITISNILADFFSARTTQDIHIFFVVKRDRETNELIYQLDDDGSHVRFNHVGIAVSMTLKLAYPDCSYDCIITTSIDRETHQRVDQISVTPDSFSTLEMEVSVDSVLKRTYSKKQLAYSPLFHEEMDLSGGLLTSNDVVLTNLTRLFHRAKCYDAYLSHPDLRYQSKQAATHCQSLASYFFDVFKYRYNHMRNQVDQDKAMNPDLKIQIKDALIALKVKHHEYLHERCELIKKQLSRAVMKLTDAQQQERIQAQQREAIEKKIALDKSDAARRELLALEENQRAKKSKPLQKKSEPAQRKKPPEKKPSFAETQFQNKFDELNPLMEQTLAHLRKNSSAPSQEIINQIARIEEKHGEIRDFFNNNHLEPIERRENQLDHLNRCWSKIKTHVPPVQSAVEAAPSPIFPIDTEEELLLVSLEFPGDNPVEMSPPISPVAVNGRPHFFAPPSKDRKVGIHDPYSTQVIAEKFMEYPVLRKSGA